MRLPPSTMAPLDASRTSHLTMTIFNSLYIFHFKRWNLLCFEPFNLRQVIRA